MRPAPTRTWPFAECLPSRHRVPPNGRQPFGGCRRRRACRSTKPLPSALCRNRSLVDGNKWLALASTVAFYGMNGYRLQMTNDAAYDLVTDVVTSEGDDVPATARVRKAAARQRRR